MIFKGLAPFIHFFVSVEWFQNKTRNCQWRYGTGNHKLPCNEQGGNYSNLLSPVMYM